MAKKDNNEDEYKDNLDNSSSNDDEDFGLPDLDDESTDTESTEEESSDDTEKFELPSEEDVSSETITFETEDDSSEEDTSTEYITEDTIEEEPVDEYDDEDYEDEDESVDPAPAYVAPKESSAPIIITLSIIVILACAAVYFIFFWDSSSSEEIVEKPVKDTATVVVEKPIEVEEPVIEEPIEEIPEEPVINTLNVRTGRSYVVVGSFFDDDLAMDYAKSLKKKGTSSYIIPPFGKSKFTRVAVEETSSFSDASTIANELAGQYKEQPWPLKY